MRATVLSLGLTFVLLGCGGDDAATPDASTAPRCDTPPGPFPTGDADGAADPLAAPSGESRAGRLTQPMIDAANAPPYLTWAAGDFVLANDRVAMVIEDVGQSDLYDPWGGKPVAVARVAGGALAAPANFGELFLMTEKSTLVTTTVTVMNDGSDGNAAVVRATGRLAPLPFLSNLLAGIYFDDLTDVEEAIDYALAPGSDVVEVTVHVGSPRAVALDTGAQLHGFMYEYRMPAEVDGRGFTNAINGSDWINFVDDRATSWSYHSPDGTLGSSLAVSGFLGAFTPTYSIAACGVTDHHHADILIGSANGLDGLVVAHATVDGTTLRAITGTTTPGAHVHATLADGSYLTRTTADDTGAYTLHVPAADDVRLTAYLRGYETASADVAAASTTADLPLPASGSIHVVAQDANGPVPARVQVLPAAGTILPTVPDEYGEPGVTSGRLDVEYPVDGDITVPVPPGDWEVIVSRGYEYEISRQTVTVTADQQTDVDVTLDRVVDTTGVQCGDFHIHTSRSNDSGDDATQKVMSAAADGLELPVRTDHEWVGTFAPLIQQLGLTPWQFGIGSIEMTSFQIWGHMGVFPLVEDDTKPNGGAPQWQTWPTADAPDTKVATKNPKDVFAAVRARPEAPAIIINHPRGSSDYFGYAGLDPATGQVSKPEVWDDQFKLVEVFNDSDWLHNRDRTVADWFSLLNTGRKVFAVGSSDSHGITSSPVGYPRTCIRLGGDDPSTDDADTVRDELSAGHAVISGGIYVDADIDGARPGDTATGVGATAAVHVRVQAATWIDADSIDVVIDGVTVQTIPLTGTGVTRFDDTIDVPVAAAGSWVVFAAYGDTALDPVHPGRIPFGVTNPIFLQR
jgi:hypothetical protein